MIRRIAQARLLRLARGFGSAGSSLLNTHDGGKRFYWPAIAGAWKAYVGGGTPREFGPCGDVLDGNAPLLFRHFERRYLYLLAATPAASEALLVPFSVKGKPVGTLWVMAHDDRRRFDAEDLRQLESLGRFASAAYQAVQQGKADDTRRAALNLMEDAVEAREAVERLNLELRENQQRLRFTLETANAGDWDLDLLTGTARCSFRHDRCFGATEPIPDWSYEKFLGHIHPDDRVNEDRKFRAAVASGRDSNLECRVVWPDGSVHWIESSGTIYRHVDGKPARMLGMVRDITERKRADEAVRESETRFRALVSASSDALYLISADWTTMRQLQGRDFIADTKEPTGAWLEKYIPPDEQARVMRAIGEAVRTNSTFALEHGVLRVDGTPGWTSSRAVPLLDARGEIVEWVGMASDVTERRVAEEALRQSEERYRGLTDQVKDYAIFRTDLEGRAITWNQGVKRVLGFDEADFIGRDITQAIFTPEDAASGVARQELATAATEGSANNDRWMRRKSGERFYANGVTSALVDDHGQLVGYTKVMRDMTEQGRIEQELRDSEERGASASTTSGASVFASKRDRRATSRSWTTTETWGMTWQSGSPI